METKHTPGQWEISSEASNLFKVCAKEDKRNSDNKRLVIASIPWESPWESDVRRTKEQAEANAKLIAAAPELLEALIKVSEYLPKSDLKNLVNNAINKATK